MIIKGQVLNVLKILTIKTINKIGVDIMELDIVVILQKDLGVLELFAQFIIQNGIKKKN